MAQQNDLIQLVNSLTANEKRFIRIRLSEAAGPPTKTLELFDLLCRKKVNKFQDLKMLIEDSRLLPRLAATKHYLYKTILLHLRHFHHDSEVRVRLHNLLIDGILLYRRNLFTQSRSIFLNARELSYEYDLKHAGLEIETWLRRIQRRLAANETLPDSENYDLTRALIRENELAHIYHDLISTRSDDKISGSASSPMDQRSSFRNQDYELNIRAIQAIRQQEFDLAGIYFDELRTWWELHPHMIREEADRFRTVLLNGLIARTMSGKNQSSHGLKDDLQEEILPPGLSTAPLPGAELLVVRMYDALNRLDLEASAALTPEAIKLIESPKSGLSTGKKLSLLYNTTLSLRLNEETKQAFELLPHLKLPRTPAPPAPTYLATLRLFMLISIDLGEIQTLDALYRRGKRRIEHSQDSSAVEIILLQSLRKISGLLPGSGRNDAIKTLLREIQPHQNSGLQGLTELAAWLQAKTHNQTLRESLRQINQLQISIQDFDDSDSFSGTAMGTTI